MSLKFGTSGLRGLSTDLDGPASALYTHAFISHMRSIGALHDNGPVLIGRDFRDSSPSIASICAATIRAKGHQPIDCGTIPTPALALMALADGAPALMITGSHIPADRNGIKFYRPDGEIDKRDELEITRIAADTGTMAVPNDNRTANDGAAKAIGLFMERNRALLPAGALSGLKIGVYQHSTVARDLFVEILRHYGATVTPLGRSGHFIPVDTEAVSAETLASLQQWARVHKLDAIVSADGDGDRPLLADDTGTPLRGDLLGLITAQFLNAEVVVTPVTSNSGIEAAGTYDTIRTRVGSPFVIAGMNEAVSAGRARVMGFEANGGLMTASRFVIGNTMIEPLPTRDCFLPTLAVLYAAASGRKSLKDLAEAYHLPFADADRLEHFPVETSAALMAHLRSGTAELAAFLAPIGDVAGTSDIDGLRVTLSDGRIIHFRPSGNAPEMRCYVEARTQDAARDLLAKGLARIRSYQESPG